MPNVCKRYCREEAIEYAREHLGSEVDDDPLEAMLQGVRIASGIVAFHRRKVELLDVVTPEDVRALEAANMTCQRVAEMAVRGGVAERLVQVTERMGDTRSACEKTRPQAPYRPALAEPPARAILAPFASSLDDIPRRSTTSSHRPLSLRPSRIWL